MAFNLLIVDDDPLVQQSIDMIVKDPWKFHGASCLKSIPSGTTLHAAFVDMHLSDDLEQTEGLQVLSALRKTHPHIELIAISGDLNQKLMENGLKCGASKFLAKPLSPEEVLLTLEKIEAHYLLQNTISQNFLHYKHSHAVWIGSSASSLKIRHQVSQLKGETAPILIHGETGTGKEVVSQMLGTQESGPFIQVNIASLPENLFESEIFGHIKGSFTGANQNKIGLAEAAHNGTLLLDEIEALPTHLQVKLLRFLESGEIKRIGSTTAIHLNVRVITTTNENLDSKVSDGSFREDLLWRIKSHLIELPPLRDRKEDIKELAQYFLKKERPHRNKSFTEEGIESLQDHPWPGNVRELKRVCEQLSLHSPLPIIREEDIKHLLQPSPNHQDLPKWEQLDFSKGLSHLVNQYEAKLIRITMQQDKNIDNVTKKLQISRSSLYKKLKDYDISK